MAPSALLAAGRNEVARYGVDLIEGKVDRVAAGFEVELSDGTTLGARRLLFATGVVDEVPDVPGIAERWGRDVLHCPYCHGWEVRGQALGVIGAAPASADFALLLRQWSEDVTFFSHTYALARDERARLEARGISVVAGDVARLVIDDDRLTGVEMGDGRIYPRSAIFVRPVIRPRADGLLAGLGCHVGADGFVTTGAMGLTSVPGVWAAGNVADARAQVITAAGEGSTAAIAINADLVIEDVELALARRA